MNHGATYRDALVSQDAQHIAHRANYSTQGAQTPCHLAAEHGHAETLRYLAQLPHASALDARASDGMTPLHLACSAGHADVVRALLEEFGANANLQDSRGHNALYHAVHAHCGACVRDLLAHGARVDEATFALARDQGNKAIISLLPQKL